VPAMSRAFPSRWTAESRGDCIEPFGARHPICKPGKGRRAGIGREAATSALFGGIVMPPCWK
jgi:hypothetical protein